MSTGLAARQSWQWNSERLPEPARVVRWGHFGAPVLLFPTAGGDYEEVERFKLIHVLGPLIDTGRIKVYSIDSVAGKTWLAGSHSPEYCSRVQNLFDSYIYNEIVPHIRRDCASSHLEIIAAGASIGAFNAVASVCRHPDAFRLAIDCTQQIHRKVDVHALDLATRTRSVCQIQMRTEVLPRIVHLIEARCAEGLRLRGTALLRLRARAELR